MKIIGWIRYGNKTACGGTVVEGDSICTSHGRAYAFQGARVACRKGYYAPSEGAGGNHIDLWNGSRMTSIFSGLRTRFNIVLPNWSDLRKSKRIRFFPVA